MQIGICTGRFEEKIWWTGTAQLTCLVIDDVPWRFQKLLRPGSWYSSLPEKLECSFSEHRIHLNWMVLKPSSTIGCQGGSRERNLPTSGPWLMTQMAPDRRVFHHEITADWMVQKSRVQSSTRKPLNVYSLFVINKMLEVLLFPIQCLGWKRLNPSRSSSDFRSTIELFKSVS